MTVMVIDERIEDFFTAVRKTDIELIKATLEKEPDAVSWRRRGRTPLHSTVRYGEHQSRDSIVPVIDLLLEHGADVNALTEKSHRSVLDVHCATWATPPEVLSFLIEHGANVNQVNMWGDTPLHTLARGGLPLEDEHIENFFRLLKGGVDVNIRNNAGETALDLATEQGTTPFVRLLLDAGA